MSGMTTGPTGAGWRCATCGAEHSGLVTVFGPEAPDLWLEASDEERGTGDMNADLCELTVDGRRHYFLRGQLEIPVHDPAVDVFTWSVWVSLSPESMQTTLENWAEPDRADRPPMFCWVATSLPYDPPTNPLRARVHTRPPGMAPFVELDPGQDHPLVREQQRGISVHRIAEINQQLLG